MTTLPLLLLLLFILNLGIAFGAGLYEMRIVLPLWFHRSDNGNYKIDHHLMRQTDVGRKFWAMVTTLPLTLLTLINLFLASKSQTPAHDWWLAACCLSLVERIGTFAFFIPTAIRMERSELKHLSDVNTVVGRWVRLNYVRNLVTLVALLLTLRTVLFF